jgi:hypothetical protein
MHRERANSASPGSFAVAQRVLHREAGGNMHNKLDTIDPNKLDNTTGGGLYDTWKKTTEKVGGVIRDLINPRPNGPQRPCVVCGRG